MKLLHQRNIVFVGVRSGRATIVWPGVTVGFGVFTIAFSAAGLLGWYLLSLATGADFVRGIAIIVSMSFVSAAVVINSVVTGSLRRPVNELPAL